jgi:hypothetical protein
MEGKMKKLRFSRPSPAMVIACLALFVALGGTAAAVKIGSGKIKNGAVTKKKLHKKAVTGSRLGDGAVTTAKIADLAVSQGKLGDASVSNGKLQSDSVSQGKLQGDSVSQGKIQQGAVTQGKITGPIGLEKVAASTNEGAIDLPAPFNSGTCVQAGLPVPGAQPGDAVQVLPVNNAGVDGRFFYAPGESEGAEVQFWVCNFSGAGVVDPDDQTVRVAVFR